MVPVDVDGQICHLCSQGFVTHVTTITDYAHEVISVHQYPGSDSIHSKAIRSYLGVGRSAIRY